MSNLPSFFKTLFLEPENLSKKSRIITLVICAAAIVGAFLAMYVNNIAYGQDGLEGLAESAQKLECRIDAIEKENKTSMDAMDKLKCEMGDLLK